MAAKQAESPAAAGKDALRKYLAQTIARLDADGGRMSKVTLRTKVMPQVVEGVQRLSGAAPTEMRDNITCILSDHGVMQNHTSDATSLIAALRQIDDAISGNTKQPPPQAATASLPFAPATRARPATLERQKTGDMAVTFVRQTSGTSQKSQASAGGSSTGKFKHVFTPVHAGSLDNSYETLDELLGEGSFGKIYKVRVKNEGAFQLEVSPSGKDESQSWRAIKTVSSEMTPARFETEVSVQRQLDHPNIAKLYEVFKDKLKYYLVIELCTGGELFDRVVEAGGTFGEGDCAMYMRQSLAALNYLHKHHVAHRDMKPENLLLHSKDKDSPLKLIDFGCARTYKPGTHMTTSLGTPLYVAPQVLSFQYTEKCDVWSCGVIMYLLLCGEYPFFGKDEEAILQNIEAGSFDFEDDAWEDISDGAKDVITALLTKDEGARPGADVALEHSWFSSHDSRERGNLPSSLAPKLQRFRFFSQFKKIALSVAAQNAQDESVKEMQDTFFALDKNKDGTLTYAEIMEGMQAHGMTLPEDFAEVLGDVDTDGSGSVDYTEFLASTLSRKQYLLEESLWGVFRTFDLDGDGRIQRAEFEQVVALSDQADVARVFAETDLDGDDEIDFMEFCAMMRSSGKDNVGCLDPMSP